MSLQYFNNFLSCIIIIYTHMYIENEPLHGIEINIIVKNNIGSVWHIYKYYFFFTKNKIY